MIFSIRNLILAALVAAGLILTSTALWIPVKARLAQWLLADAWAESLDRGTAVKPKQKDERQSDTAEALIAALKMKDGVKTRTLFEQWKTENSDLSDETLETIEAELTKLNQSLYAEAGSPSRSWDPSEAIKAVKKPKRISNKTHKSTLERL